MAGYMHLSRVQIKNFRNFGSLDVRLGPNVVIIGQNRVGKSNFIAALRLLLDPSTPDSARMLKLSDIWDGYPSPPDDENADYEEPEVSIDIDFTDFEDDDALLILLTDYRLTDDHTTSRLSYVFRKKEDVEGRAKTEADYDFEIFGAGDQSRLVNHDVRRRICIDVLQALSDAEGDLATWRASPLRPLLEDAISLVSQGDLEEVGNAVNVATGKLAALTPVNELETKLREQILALSGERNDIRAKFGFAPTEPLKLFRAIRMLIDDGKRGISDASLGSANLALLTLKLAEFAWRRVKNERNFTVVAIEEPESHLHPHLQRKIFGELFDDGSEGRSLLVTTHSPYVASVAPLKSIVLLKDEGNKGTKGYSLAQLSLKEDEFEDLQRYLDVTRAELLFSRGVLFVEGDAEVALVPEFARSIGQDLDALGITVCSVGGVNFKPYVRLAAALALPFAVITDWDPRTDSKPAHGWARSIDLIAAIREIRGSPLPVHGYKRLSESENHLRTVGETFGIFMNEGTLETTIALDKNLLKSLLAVLGEQEFGPSLKARIAGWENDEPLDPEQLMLMIGYVGKGRFATKLAAALKGLKPPEYIKRAIQSLAVRC